MNVGFLEFQLTNSHFKKYHSLLTGPVGAGDVTIVGAHELAPTDVGKKWCEDNKVKYCETAEEVVAMSDAILALAPNNAEKHLEVAGPALASRKPLFVDKFLADTPDTAEAIIKVTELMGTPLMSCSALRFAPELDELDKTIKGAPTAVFARGFGKFPIYAVHTIALALRYFGPDIKRVIDTGNEASHFVTLDGGNRKATIEVRDAANGNAAVPWQVGVLSDNKYQIATIKDYDPFYMNLMRNVLQFFHTGESPVSTDEQLAAVQVQYAAEKSLADGNRWVDIKA